MTFAGILVLGFGLLMFIAIPGLSLAFALLGAGVIMVLLSFFTKPPPPAEPSSPDLKFCWFCLNEIPRDLEVCPSCKMKQK